MLEELLQTGRLEYSNGNLSHAEATFHRILGIDAVNADALLMLALISRKRGQLAQALKLMQAALSANPRGPHLHVNLGLICMDAGKLAEAAAAFSTAIHLAPDFAQAYNNLAVALREQCRFGESAAACRQAISLAPNFAEAYCNLANALSGLNHHPEALTAAETAVLLNPALIDAHYNRGIALQAVDRDETAAAAFQHVLALQPAHSKALSSLGNTLRRLGRLEEAINAYTNALNIHPDDAETHWNLSLAYLLNGDYARGWIEYEWRHRCTSLFRTQTFPEPQWNGEPLDGRTILLHSEQGLGDSIMFARYAPLVSAAGGKVVLQCQPELCRLFEQIYDIHTVIPRTQAPPHFDLHCPLMSLPLVFSTMVQSIPSRVPYIEIDNETADDDSANQAVKPLAVGLVWAGGAVHRNDRLRSMRLSVFEGILKTGGVTFFSLQKGPPAEQLQQLPSDCSIEPAVDRCIDFADTAEVVSRLDLVITVDTAMAHLAGALGKPVWVLLPFDPDWRWLLNRTDSPWYPTMRLFRQKAPGDWEPVIADIKTALQLLIAGRKSDGAG